LKVLNGEGPKASSLGKKWEGGGLGYKGIKYNIGPSPSWVALNLVNEQEYVITPMWNVIGIINGSFSDEVVILGNHRDAWIAGGAGDPNSGSAALNEVIRSFGVAQEQGWKPTRTLVFASWDGEEYGLIGSTEWVEEFLPWLSKTCVAYLNVDVGTVGPYFKAAASPLLNSALYAATALVPSPNQTVANQTVRDTWSGHISTMGSGSDFTAFQDFAGIPSLDMGFSTGKDSAIYHYHSNYDSFDWMDRFGDPGWHYHVTAAKLWSVLAAYISETPVLPLNTSDYSLALLRYLDDTEKELATALDAQSQSLGVADSPTALSHSSYALSEFRHSLLKLRGSVKELFSTSIEFDLKAATLLSKLQDGIPWWKWWQKPQLYFAIRRVNAKYKLFERQFLYAEGLDGRPWFKHVVFAPGLWTGYSGATYPGLVESVDDKDWANGKKWAKIIKDIVRDANKSLD
jgi:N-acetylated-alpha-linked acidic dipeptidase